MSIRDYTHLALWDPTDNPRIWTTAVIIWTQGANQQYVQAVRNTEKTEWRIQDQYGFVITPNPKVARDLAALASAAPCPICIRLQNPCWWWRSVLTVLASMPGTLKYTALDQPSAQDEHHLLVSAAPNALSQLIDGSAELRTAMRENIFPMPLRRPRREMTYRQALEADDLSNTTYDIDIDRSNAPAVRQMPATIHQAPTPVGTIRCTHCGQVIPPGFTKEADPKKTVDEIYAECKHEFDPTTKICKKCRMEERSDSRFSFLEVD